MYREREDEYAPEAASPYQCSAVASPDDIAERQVDADLEHYILGSWNKGKGLKKNGLMKKVNFLHPAVPHFRADRSV